MCFLASQAAVAIGGIADIGRPADSVAKDPKRSFVTRLSYGSKSVVLRRHHSQRQSRADSGPSLDVCDQARSEPKAAFFDSSGSLGGWSNRASRHFVTTLYQL